MGGMFCLASVIRISATRILETLLDGGEILLRGGNIAGLQILAELL